MRNKAVIGIGSNIAPDKNIAKTRQLLAQRFTVLKESPYIRTKPIGKQKQPDFMNGAVLIETEKDQTSVIQELKSLEKEIGRTPDHDPQGPRTIDLDLVVWNNQVIDPDVFERDFLKKLVLDVAPSLESSLDIVGTPKNRKEWHEF